MSARFLFNYAHDLISFGDDSLISDKYLAFCEHMFFRSQQEENLKLYVILSEVYDRVLFRPKHVQDTADTLRRLILLRQLIQVEPPAITVVLKYARDCLRKMTAFFRTNDEMSYNAWVRTEKPNDTTREA